ncbi:futalosine hydrolase [Streptacidiphilus sp. PB12-B1b]|uniref:futalosine hydrolase n=1 Tax=Streptacidiphilus sp. PB12-B1b TaxID=2705012 RepID=UPI0015F9DE47|nr:futalosine hydrolase [Streptacidiphilus sp. PB12-B1b]QMU74949.1 futalosine hydrolase [Streptacidiphilus sp. PB12-B1b]
MTSAAPRLLVVTAVAPEAAAVLRGVGAALPDAEPTQARLPGGHLLHRHGPVDVLAAGVGPAAAAAGTATALAVDGYALVVSAGICGGFAPAAPLGCAVVADAIVAADLGAQTPDGFASVTELGFGRVRHETAHAGAVARALRAAGLPTAVGAVLTVSTVTGSAERAAELTAGHPGAVGEAMEGFGVAEAAAAHGTPVLELRAVSNAVGPRDRAAWRIGDAFATLERAFAALPYRDLPYRDLPYRNLPYPDLSQQAQPSQAHPRGGPQTAPSHDAPPGGTA